MRGTTGKRDGSYYYSVIVGTKPDGRPDRRYRRFKTKRERDDALTELLNQLNDGSYTPPSKLTIREYIESHWFPLVETRLRPTTLSTYRNQAKYIVDRLGGEKLQTLTAARLNRFYKELATSGLRNREGGLSKKSLSNAARLVHKLLQDALKMGLVQRNVATLVDLPKVEGRQTNTWTPELLRKFIEGTQDHPLHAALFLLCTSGLRRAELLGLAWKDLDLDKGSLRVTQTLVVVDGKPLLQPEAKTKAGHRMMMLDPVTVSVLRAHKIRQTEARLLLADNYEDHGLVFCEADGTFIHPSNFTRLVGRLSKNLGLPRSTPHPLRHSYATSALLSGTQLKTLSTRLGHSSIQVTADIYQHFLERDDQEAANSIADVILGGG